MELFYTTRVLFCGRFLFCSGNSTTGKVQLKYFGFQEFIFFKKNLNVSEKSYLIETPILLNNVGEILGLLMSMRVLPLTSGWAGFHPVSLVFCSLQQIVSIMEQD